MFGLCILEMISGEVSYKECTTLKQLNHNILENILPFNVYRIPHKHAREVIELCLRPDDCRPTAAELLQHEFLRPSGDEDDETVLLRK